MPVKRIIYVANVDWFFISHRLPLAKEALRRGWKVYLISKDTGSFNTLEQLGIECISIELERSGKNPLKELKIIRRLKNIYAEIQPDIVHHITLKPCIYGTIALRNNKKVKIINAVSGLGYSFTDNRKSISQRILLRLLDWAFRNKSGNFIFQNPDDLALYESMGFLNADNNITIKGSGVDEILFKYVAPKNKEVLTVTLLARMLKDKGVIEFIQAARLLEDKYTGRLKFLLIGGIDVHNPAHISERELKDYCDTDYLIWMGHQKDVMSVYADSDIVCLPSYREGLPKSLIEAMAIGRPIITTDAIGCRECVDEGENGFLVPVKDSVVLAHKIEILVQDAELRIKMGLCSRNKMVNEMSLNHVVNQTFAFYEK